MVCIAKQPPVLVGGLIVDLHHGQAMQAALDAVGKALQTGRPLCDIEEEMDWNENQGRKP